MPRVFFIAILFVTALLYPVHSFAANADLELRGGVGTLCGTCIHTSSHIRATGQLFADLLFPVGSLEWLEVGPYLKAAGFEDTFIGAGGLAVGFAFSRFEILINGGLAYAGSRIGAFRGPNGEVHDGQSQGTYDLGLSLRMFGSRAKKGWYGSFQYTHNSNGEQIGLNWLSDKKSNPGIDSVTVGVGYRF
jgi:hypothetical protein